MIFHTRPADFSPKFTVVACFCEWRGKILLLLRQDHKPQGNTWCLPAGKVEASETLSQAIIRELEEEIGLSAREQDLEKVGFVFDRYAAYDYEYHMFRWILESNRIILNLKEHKEFCWITPEAALSLRLIEDEDPCIII